MSLLGWLYGADDLQEQSNALDAVIASQNQQAVEKGRWTQAQAEAAAQHQALGNISTGANDVDGSINQAFDEGWAEGRANVSSAIKNTLNRIVADPLRAVIGGVPWWLWGVGIIGLIFLAWRAGLLNGLIRRTKAKLA